MRDIKWAKLLFFMFLVKPLVFVGLGLNLVNRQKLPHRGPAILAANHTSHLDTLVLMSLYPLSALHKVRPVAAADYFLKNKWLAWFSHHCLDIIPIDRQGKLPREQLLEGCYQALKQGQIIIFFPEGTRSLTEERDFQLKRGIHALVRKYPQTYVAPIMLRGLGKALPKGEGLLVPFNCDVIIGDKLAYADNSSHYMATLKKTYEHLQKYNIH